MKQTQAEDYSQKISSMRALTCSFKLEWCQVYFFPSKLVKKKIHEYI